LGTTPAPSRDPIGIRNTWCEFGWERRELRQIHRGNEAASDVLGLDFATVWGIAETQTYPYLRVYADAT